MDVSFSPEDLAQIAAMGKTPEAVCAEIAVFEQGVAATRTTRACTLDDGILRLDDAEVARLQARYKEAQHAGRITRFVPASGAASRMFKALHAARERPKGTPLSAEAAAFCENLDRFAFAGVVAGHLQAWGATAADPDQVLKALLDPAAMNYGALPKGLLLFHTYADGPRTPVEEHLAETLAYGADADGRGRLHFTVSPEHLSAFRAHVAAALPAFAARGLQADISYSIQKQATDTAAVTPDNQPFRDDDGRLLFRPGGHGALISNLADLGADIVFIKNIDNVVPDHLKGPTIAYKTALGGLLVELQARIFGYLRDLDAGAPDAARIEEICAFAGRYLGLRPDPAGLSEPAALRALLHRPLRVCGMVKNEGEPGGGPFWVDGARGEGLQIVEASQIDTAQPDQAANLAGATHFNPVDLVCGLRDYRGEAFDLAAFIDHDACFISDKSHQGRPLKALELPGLWNGAMADWHTCFVEVPAATFNPVKTVNDLLRPQHQTA